MSVESVPRKRSLLRWPLVLIWRATTAVSNRIGILASIGVGAIAMLIGFFLIGTLVGAVIGIPMFLLGLLLFLRGLI
ncbi:MAG TPA: hypothetical protein PLJ47_10765 [Candidatus Hydrogenedentes bacterium]|mgnify:CR=1 FL=1|nr:hypothetical protein [Candidatus Hydrogenedentota bacterium]HRK35064.1 hypothetical protein [Candidatus Hydrogenedentota bacterium]